MVLMSVKILNKLSDNNTVYNNVKFVNKNPKSISFRLFPKIIKGPLKFYNCEFERLVITNTVLKNCEFYNCHFNDSIIGKENVYENVMFVNCIFNDGRIYYTIDKENITPNIISPIINSTKLFYNHIKHDEEENNSTKYKSKNIEETDTSNSSTDERSVDIVV